MEDRSERRGVELISPPLGLVFRITSDGAPPNQGTEYFAGRSRRFAIQIEGRFKQREGSAPYDADEVSLSLIPFTAPRLIAELLMASVRVLGVRFSSEGESSSLGGRGVGREGEGE